VLIEVILQLFAHQGVRTHASVSLSPAKDQAESKKKIVDFFSNAEDTLRTQSIFFTSQTNETMNRNEKANETK
jgi:hypothetical protein